MLYSKYQKAVAEAAPRGARNNLESLSPVNERTNQLAASATIKTIMLPSYQK